MILLLCTIYTLSAMFFFYYIIKLINYIFKMNITNKQKIISILIFGIIYFVIFYYVQIVMLPTSKYWHTYDKVLSFTSSFGQLLFGCYIFEQIVKIGRKKEL